MVIVNYYYYCDNVCNALLYTVCTQLRIYGYSHCDSTCALCAGCVQLHVHTS